MLAIVAFKVAVTFGKNRRKIDPYLAALSMAGLEAIPVSAELAAVAEWMDGLVLTGGADVGRVRHGQPKWDESGDPDLARDEMEASLLKRALDSDLAVLAICRGMQTVSQLTPQEKGASSPTSRESLPAC